MNSHPPIKRHEVFLIIALLFALNARAADNGWQALFCALVGLGYIIASGIERISTD